MEWSEFSTYQARAKVPFKLALQHLKVLQDETTRCYEELEKELADILSLRNQLEGLIYGPYRAAVLMLKAESLLAEKTSRTQSEVLGTAVQDSAEKLRLVADLFTLGGNAADEMSPEAVAAVIAWGGLLVSFGGLILGGPVGTSIGLIVGGADALNRLRLLVGRAAERTNRLIQHRRDESIREMLDSAINLLTELANSLADLCSRFQHGCDPILQILRDNRTRAKALIRLAENGA